MDLDTFLAVCCCVLLVICHIGMIWCSKNVYLKYNKTGNACPSKKSITR